MYASPDPRSPLTRHRGGQGSAGPVRGLGDADEAAELRREIETHLSMLEEDAMKNDPGSADTARKATQEAEEQFGNAVDHFRRGLAELERGQRLLRRMAVTVVLITLLVAAAGVVMNAWIMFSIRSLVSDWSSRATPVEPDWGVYRFDAVLLELQAKTSVGLVRTNARLSTHDWVQLSRTLRGARPGGASDALVVSGPCGDSAWPVIELPTFPPEVLGDDPVVPLRGSTVICTPIRAFEATTPIAAGLHSESLVKALSEGVVVDCVPVPRRSPASR